ncbi:hypothetical protein FICEBENF_01549 [Aeromonas hydrophila]
MMVSDLRSFAQVRLWGFTPDYPNGRGETS